MITLCRSLHSHVHRGGYCGVGGTGSPLAGLTPARASPVVVPGGPVYPQMSWQGGSAESSQWKVAQILRKYQRETDGAIPPPPYPGWNSRKQPVSSPRWCCPIGGARGDPSRSSAVPAQGWPGATSQRNLQDEECGEGPATHSFNSGLPDQRLDGVSGAATTTATSPATYGPACWTNWSGCHSTATTAAAGRHHPRPWANDRWGHATPAGWGPTPPNGRNLISLTEEDLLPLTEGDRPPLMEEDLPPQNEDDRSPEGLPEEDLLAEDQPPPPDMNDVLPSPVEATPQVPPPTLGSDLDATWGVMPPPPPPPPPPHPPPPHPPPPPPAAEEPPPAAPAAAAKESAKPDISKSPPHAPQHPLSSGALRTQARQLDLQLE